MPGLLPEMKKIRPCSTSNIYRRQTSEYAEVGDMTIANLAFSSSAVANKDHGNTYMKSMINMYLPFPKVNIWNFCFSISTNIVSVTYHRSFWKLTVFISYIYTIDGTSHVYLSNVDDCICCHFFTILFFKVQFISLIMLFSNCRWQTTSFLHLIQGAINLWNTFSNDTNFIWQDTQHHVICQGGEFLICKWSCQSQCAYCISGWNLQPDKKHLSHGTCIS